MLDEGSRALLTAVNDVCADGGFKIVDEAELNKLCPLNVEIAETLSFLEESGFLELRYAEEGTYCVRVLPKGRSFAEREDSERRASTRTRRDMFWFAFFGALLGGLIGAVFLVLLSLLLP